ncbi:cyclodeaminase/cyclohydrolase family protein [Stackebrandtia nassauensis]|uniref:Formiminotransferase-cyclodeaminase n=1 Tax=Stackebrandtia nassauensis (strain DSM 44728 / CIP 108903 / NRRL B-16338 / NBRC 102104 / LLR-40K-21) TaxID=446470 RepID=D3QAN0_STANL|nr:cyclodeaminase/cyclohydrolase family protein [Stackebrandtia nassauensis]ADD44676.1 Formiminotransferase-cyclodeaminase [Stackebrandtia nassauensis DSM 44728]
MRDQKVGEWLEKLASKASAPGGGAAAALNAATGAALVSMVCNLTIGKPKYVEHELTMTDVLSKANELRNEALVLAEADAEAFSAVMAAYGLPKDSDEDKAQRTEAIQSALVRAAEVPLRIAGLAAEVIALSGRILDGANVNVLSDVAVAADSARSALRSAAINVEINLYSMKDEDLREELAGKLADHLGSLDTADRIVGSVNERITS